ncbi:hypothetical protein GMB50_11745 [Turicibacter sanguinis]|uniref:DEAD/DEAH box helicase family protein n=1 Tax=Turicibacter sanguinis TaxID=154288 RepID=UPI0012BD645B|nr:DEAD/DEAH box helicase family protein [Turicibacter sanguinis]MDB8566250.1 DEAD/DEAH box helicase family protein [Turicibacter sanguinis]MDB8568886.1 DEAD/DEAH box helicase family protein [Turicibacter sanguinis]MDB8571751.1 DEAD/DEAH box helicase family protein [Turicibacter sanguinis]MDB8580394.1 DEAD/DEAH box helicase family protein [Turicibacter sanguinis]MTO10659.1 hypothetical protein [Turicibacter sanguinis]
MEKKYYLNDLWNNRNYQLKDDKVNGIIGYCGCGKSYFIMKQFILSEQPTIYVSDTTALKEEMFMNFGEELRKKYNYKSVYDIIEEKRGKYGSYYQIKAQAHYELNFELNELNVKFMTYSTFAKYLEDGTIEKMLLTLDKTTIIFDEAHNIYEYAESFDDNNEYPYQNIIDFLEDNDTYDLAQIIAITATPNQLQYQSYFHDVLGKDKELLKRYTHKKEIKYSTSIENLLHELKPNENNKVLIYTSGSVASIQKMVTNLQQQYSIEFLYSKSNRNYTFTPKQESIYQELVQNGNFSQVDVLLINQAYQSGINIFELDCNTFIYDVQVAHQPNQNHNENYDFIQSLGRIRHNIKNVFIRVPFNDITMEDKSDLDDFNRNDERKQILDQYLNVKLTANEFKDIVKELNFTDKLNRLLTGASAVKEIEKLGYDILDKKSNGKRYKVINKLF